MYCVYQHQDSHSVVALCAALDILRASYYRWASKPTTTAAQETVAAASDLTAAPTQRRRQDINRLMLQQFSRHRRRYGACRIVPELVELGYRVGSNQVRAIHQQFGLRAIQPKSFIHKITQPNPNRRRSPNPLLKAPPPLLADWLWVGDIIYLSMLG